MWKSSLDFPSLNNSGRMLHSGSNFRLLNVAGGGGMRRSEPHSSLNDLVGVVEQVGHETSSMSQQVILLKDKKEHLIKDLEKVKTETMKQREELQRLDHEKNELSEREGQLRSHSAELSSLQLKYKQMTDEKKELLRQLIQESDQYVTDYCKEMMDIVSDTSLMQSVVDNHQQVTSEEERKVSLLKEELEKKSVEFDVTNQDFANLHTILKEVDRICEVSNSYQIEKRN